MSIKKYPWFLSFIPHRAFTFYPYIFFRKDIYQDLYTKNPEAHTLGTLIHEQTHLKRIKKAGILKFGLLYLFSPKYRFQEEIKAITEQFKYLKKYGETINVEKWARALSSWQYLWCVSYKEAKNTLQNLS